MKTAADEAVQAAKAGADGGTPQDDRSIAGIVVRQGTDATGYRFRVATLPVPAAGEASR